MGWRFKKAVNLGGLRLNLSKRGLGFSWGFPMFRTGISADGRRYIWITVPRTGISWMKYFGSEPRPVIQSQMPNTSVPQSPASTNSFPIAAPGPPPPQQTTASTVQQNSAPWWKQKNISGSSGAKPGALTTGVNDVIEVPRVCAMFDKPWVARYVCSERGLFRLVDTAKPGRNTPVLGKGNAAAMGVTLNDSQISRDSQQEQCPWCGVKGKLVFCEGCSAWVCRSRVTKREDDEYFRCRESCGNAAIITTTTRGYEGRKGKPLTEGKNLTLPEKPNSQIGTENRPRL